MTIILVWVTAHCFPVRHSLLCSTRMFLLLNAEKRDKVPKFLKCVHTSQNYRALLFFGAVYCAVQGDSNF